MATSRPPPKGGAGNNKVRGSSEGKARGRLPEAQRALHGPLRQEKKQDGRHQCCPRPGAQHIPSHNDAAP